jgi:RimJ/RimL family protein N-acetyltransferase
MTTLHTRSLTLRPWALTDVDALLAHANDKRIWMNLRDRFPHPYTRADAESWLGFATTQPEPHHYLAITLGDEAIGAIGLDAHPDVNRFTAEIGYWLGVAHWGRGYATDAVRAATTYGFEQLGLERICANVFEWNPASERILVKAGFRMEGRLRRHVFKDGRFGDALLYAIVRQDYVLLMSKLAKNDAGVA